jgi:stage V sporulation protein AC
MMKNKDNKIFKKALDQNKIKRPIFKNALKAFLVGGLISLIGQGFLDLYIKVLKLDKSISNSLMSITLVFIASLLTGLGIFDKIGQFAGAGSFIPITGFSNSLTASALESKSEGLVLGIMMNMFKLAGSVIVAGAISAFIAGSIVYLGRILL